MATYWATDCLCASLLRNTMKIRNCLETTDLAPGLLYNFLTRVNSEHYRALLFNAIHFQKYPASTCEQRKRELAVQRSEQTQLAAVTGQN